MKKNCSNRIIACFVLLCFFFASCGGNSLTYFQQENNISKYSNSIISNKIETFKNEGLLSFVYDNNSFRSIETQDFDYTELEYFIDNVDICISEITNEEGGDDVIYLLNTIYGEKTIGEVYDAMEIVSPDLAKEYNAYLVDIVNPVSNYRSIIENNHIREIKLSFSADELSSNRSADLSDAYTWGSVAGYVGATAAALAGILVWKHVWTPWGKVAGLVAAGVGITAMSVLIAVWQKSIDWKVFQNFCTSLYNSYDKMKKNYSDVKNGHAKEFLDDLSKKLKDYLIKNPSAACQINEVLEYIDRNYFGFKNAYDAFNTLINYYNKKTEVLPKTITVSASTVAVFVVSSCSGFSGVLKGWVDAFNSFIPDWFVFTSDGFMISFTF